MKYIIETDQFVGMFEGRTPEEAVKQALAKTPEAEKSSLAVYTIGEWMAKGGVDFSHVTN